MRYSIRVAPGVRLRPSRRGIGVSLGKGRTWLYLGPTGAGASTGVGAVRFYQWHGGRRGRRPALSQYEREQRAAQRAQELQALAARVEHLLSLHRQEFPPARPPVAPPARPVDEKEIERRWLRRERAGIPWFRRRERRAARERARAAAAREIAQERRRREEEREALQRELDEHWRLLCANDPPTVLETLEAAFADNEAPAAPIDCENGRATVVLLVEGEELVPERVPTLTPTGRPTTRKLSQTDRNRFYRSWIFSNVLVTAKEAFAVAPGLAAVTVVALRRETNPFGETRLSALYAGTFSRDRFERLDFSRDDVLDAPLYAEEVRLETKGRTMAVRPLDLDKHPDLKDLVEAASSELGPGP